MRNFRTLTIAFSAVLLTVALTDSAPALKESSAAPDVVPAAEPAPDSSADLCLETPSEAEAPSPDSLESDSGRLFVIEPFTCYFCQGCASSLVNKACCFDSNGDFMCVGECASGCVPPEFPEAPEP